ncbi:DUF6270 domain-containing protein [Priestia megaterium]|uniref:DUF6270 domain-containing protein n=1 Tax=Priestia megaterium TaxID=1404 RepID=UPI003000C9BB
MNLLVENIKYRDSAIIEIALNIPKELKSKPAELLLTRRAKHKNKSITYSQQISLDDSVIINLNDLKHLKGNSVSVEEIIDVAIKAEEQLYELSLADFNVTKIKYMTEKVWGTHWIKPYSTNKKTVAIYTKTDFAAKVIECSLEKSDLILTVEMNATILPQDCYATINGKKYAIESSLNLNTIVFRIPLQNSVHLYKTISKEDVSMQYIMNDTVVSAHLHVGNPAQLNNELYTIQLNSSEPYAAMWIERKKNDAVKVAVLGSCVTRDNFNSKFNPDYKKSYECVSLQNQSSIISLMAPALAFPQDKIDNLNDWDTWNVKTDFQKQFLKDLKKQQPDYLIIDLFGDIFFGCLRVADSFLTNNYWKLAKTSYFKELKNHDAITLQNNQDEYMELWKKAVNDLFAFLQAELPNCKVVLHKARFTDSYYDNEGQVKTIASSVNVQTLNQYWDLLDGYIQENYQIDAIDLTKEKYISYEGHPWGVFHVHFEMNYYQQFLKQLHCIVVKHYLEAEHVFATIYQELEQA